MNKLNIKSQDIPPLFRILVYFAVAMILSSCAYLESYSKQKKLKHNQKINPSQYFEKHIIERESYFVYGQLKSKSSRKNHYAMAVAALSHKYQQEEVVDINYLGKVDSYYGLNLPEGVYRLIVLEDSNEDGFFSETEVVGEHKFDLEAQAYPDGVASHIDIWLHSAPISLNKHLTIQIPDTDIPTESLFYPKGTIRSLADPIFSEKLAALGLYDPAAFTENAPMMFYALEEVAVQKVPVVFVHGIGGTAKEFEEIVEKLDRDVYKPWFFYYPSGMDLNRLAKMFYEIFLSGKVVEKELSGMVIVAHSMGGLVVREALNMYKSSASETDVKLFISIASPFEGISSAQSGVDHAPMVIPAWRNLVPNGAFIQRLFRKPLPDSIEHHLIYAYRKSGDLNDDDGVVPVSSQLPESILGSLSGQYGFQSGHAEILRDPVAMDAINNLISKVESVFPEDHMRYLSLGGFDIELDSTYSEVERYIIQSMGLYLRALANGEVEPISLNEPFLAVVHGRKKARDPFETAWIKFKKNHPDLAAGEVN